MRWKLALTAAVAAIGCAAAQASVVDLKFGATDGSSLYGDLSYDNSQTPSVNFTYGELGPFNSDQYEGTLNYSYEGQKYTDGVVINTYSYNSATQPDEFLALDFEHYTSTTLDLVLYPHALDNALLPTSIAQVPFTGSFDFTNNAIDFDPVASFNHPVGSVPETATWLMMILGFGTIGGMMRRVHRKSEENFTRKVRSIATA